MPQLSKRVLQLKKSREIRKAKHQYNTNNEADNEVDNEVDNEASDEANNFFKRLLQIVPEIKEMSKTNTMESCS
ncbi:8746_t:CDS:2 [Acaulospora morrowiae]|uniref:8746_t:CDS:1 n=1 Tax=Acaulospora morrowiae TaxID=94023 RepID=A0A9N8YLU3_9GLOM|nr:8746_t:CDS:2 [Acaulospora morrowiae]